MDAIADPFLRKALNLAVDGTDLQEDSKNAGPGNGNRRTCGRGGSQGFLESAGGYAPTIGIIGAVLGT